MSSLAENAEVLRIECGKISQGRPFFFTQLDAVVGDHLLQKRQPVCPSRCRPRQGGQYRPFSHA